MDSLVMASELPASTPTARASRQAEEGYGLSAQQHIGRPAQRDDKFRDLTDRVLVA